MRESDYEESWAPKNWCFWTVVLEKTLESPLDCKETQLVHSKRDQPWVFFGRNDAKAETPVLWPPHAELTHWKRLWCWEGLGARGNGDDRGWDGWMASLTLWAWVWVNSRRWWWTGRPGVLLFMGSQRVGHDWATELNWTDSGKGWRLEEKGNNRGWYGWMASLTQWTWVWVNSGNCWWTGRPGVLQSTGSQRVRHDWATELNWTAWDDQIFNRFMGSLVLFNRYLLGYTINSQTKF